MLNGIGDPGGFKNYFSPMGPKLFHNPFFGKLFRMEQGPSAERTFYWIVHIRARAGPNGRMVLAKLVTLQICQRDIIVPIGAFDEICASF